MLPESVDSVCFLHFSSGAIHADHQCLLALPSSGLYWAGPQETGSPHGPGSQPGTEAPALSLCSCVPLGGSLHLDLQMHPCPPSAPTLTPFTDVYVLASGDTDSWAGYQTHLPGKERNLSEVQRAGDCWKLWFVSRHSNSKPVSMPHSVHSVPTHTRPCAQSRATRQMGPALPS